MAADTPAAPTTPHKAVQDETMTIADNLSRCICGRTIAEVGTVKDRHWLHVEEPWSPSRSTPAEELDVDTLLAAERVVQGWDDEISEGGMVPLIEDLRQALERRILARLSRNEEADR